MLGSAFVCFLCELWWELGLSVCVLGGLCWALRLSVFLCIMVGIGFLCLFVGALIFGNDCVIWNKHS